MTQHFVTIASFTKEYEADLAVRFAADADEDGIADTKDECPDESERFNGVDDDDGCPDLSLTGQAHRWSYSVDVWFAMI